MNIFQLATTAIPDGIPAEDLTQIPHSSYKDEDDFRLVLGDVLKRHCSCDKILTAEAGEDGTARIVETHENVNFKPSALLGSGQDLLDVFGSNILALAAMLLDESKLPNDQESLLGMLDTVLLQIGSISTPGSMSELMSKLSDHRTKESLFERLREALFDLPESLKNKLHRPEIDILDGNISRDEMLAVQSSVITVLTGATVYGDSGGLEDINGLLNGFEKLQTSNNAAIKNTVAKNVAREPGASEEQLALQAGSSPDKKTEVNKGHENELGLAGKRPEKMDKETPGLTAKKGAVNLIQQGKIEQNLKVIDKSNSDVDAENGGKAKTSIAATVKASVEGSQSGNTASTDDESRHSNDRALMSSDTSLSTAAKHEPKTVQAMFSQTLEKTSSQGITAQPESVAQSAGLEHPFINTDRLISRIVGKLDVLLAGGKSEAKLRLKPEFLGELKIHLVMDGGSMKAVLNASTLQAKELIEANLNMLKQSLESQGLQLKEFEVSVDRQQNNGDHSSSGRRYLGRGPKSDSNTVQLGIDEPAHAKAYAMPNGSMAVDYLV